MFSKRSTSHWTSSNLTVLTVAIILDRQGDLNVPAATITPRKSLVNH
ncbi:hypothetical protein IQ218_01270 [Synechocystis salina LEGE 06099]|nr:hypothetical protein [Synechocystis salina]MBE9202356.1 hypothetical protein [Synechocystis salina LEGE 06099]